MIFELRAKKLVTVALATVKYVPVALLNLKSPVTVKSEIVVVARDEVPRTTIPPVII